MQLFGGGAGVDDRGLEIFFRFAGIVAIMSTVLLFIVPTGTPEYIVTVASLVLSLTVAVVCALIKNRKGK